VVIPDPEYLLPWAKERGLPNDLAALCRHPQVVAAALKSMLEEGRAAGLKGFEQVRRAEALGRHGGWLTRGCCAGLAAGCGRAWMGPSWGAC
jgi:hypothetical protein